MGALHLLMNYVRVYVILKKLYFCVNVAFQNGT